MNRLRVSSLVLHPSVLRHPDSKLHSHGENSKSGNYLLYPNTPPQQRSFFPFIFISLFRSLTLTNGQSILTEHPNIRLLLKSPTMSQSVWPTPKASKRSRGQAQRRNPTTFTEEPEPKKMRVEDHDKSEETRRETMKRVGLQPS